MHKCALRMCSKLCVGMEIQGKGKEAHCSSHQDEWCYRKVTATTTACTSQSYSRLKGTPETTILPCPLSKQPNEGQNYNDHSSAQGWCQLGKWIRLFSQVLSTSHLSFPNPYEVNTREKVVAIYPRCYLALPCSLHRKATSPCGSIGSQSGHPLSPSCSAPLPGMKHC